MKKRDFSVKDLNATAEIKIARNEKGFWRVKNITVDIRPKIESPEMKKRAESCRKMFEDYCIVTESVRSGIAVDVNLHF